MAESNPKFIQAPLDMPQVKDTATITVITTPFAKEQLRAEQLTDERDERNALYGRGPQLPPLDRVQIAAESKISKSQVEENRRNGLPDTFTPLGNPDPVNRRGEKTPWVRNSNKK